MRLVAGKGSARMSIQRSPDTAAGLKGKRGREGKVGGRKEEEPPLQCLKMR